MSQYIEGDHKEWDVYLPQFKFAINTSRHETTQFTPAYLNYGREIRPPGSLQQRVDNQVPAQPIPPGEELAQEVQKLQELYQVVRVRLAEGYHRQRRPYDLRHRPFRPQVGQMVYRRQHHLSDAVRNFSAKLAPKYDGPFKIHSVISPNVVMLQIPNRRDLDKVHVKDLKLENSQ